MSKHGAFMFVLHSHLPFVRLAGRWPHGEEWVHEAASETYIPLLKYLYELRDDGVAFRLTLGITPTLAEQLSDETVCQHLNDYLDLKIAAAEKDIHYFSGGDDRDSEEKQHLAYLAAYYRDFYRDIKTAYNVQFNGDLIGAFRQLQDEGYIEIMTSAATHGYLPLLATDSSIRAQIAVGVQTHERLFGRKPTTIWLPECAYRPAYTGENGELRPGLEQFLAEQGLKAFFSETHTITGGQPVGVAGGDVIGPYGEITRRYVIPMGAEEQPKRDTSTFEAYQVADSSNGSESSASSVAVIGRNDTTGQQVWSALWGYPGDFDYREFHKKSGTSGLQYWRVTGDTIDLQYKELYYPEWAAFKVEQHAEHFAHLVGDLMRDYHENSGEYGLIASNYDTELFGHWWFEGIDWLGQVLRHLAEVEAIELMTASDYLREHPPQRSLLLPESSWGAGGTHFTWDNGETHWMWRPIHEAEMRMQALADQFTDPSADEAFVLAQAAREVLLMQSSDWPFLVTTMQARNYAIQRFTQHDERFRRLAQSLEMGMPDRAYAEEMFVMDNLFAEIDYRIFRSQS